MPSGLASIRILCPLYLLYPPPCQHLMSARSFMLPRAVWPAALWTAAALWLATAVGCQSMFHDPVTAARGQSPAGLGGGIPKPPPPPKARQPGDPTDEDDTVFEQISGTVGSYFKPAPDAEKAKAAFAQADEKFLAKEYAAAMSLYKAAADLAPKSFTEEDAMFMIAECYFFQDHYSKAVDAYQSLLKKYNNTRHMDRVSARLYAIATYWRDHQHEYPHYSTTPNLIDGTRPWFDTGGYALKTYESVWLTDPTGPLAGDAVMQTANTHFQNQEWEDADEYYTQLRKDFPNSKHIVKAFFLGYRAKLQRYSGPGYDAAPLNEADELIETLLRQFNSQLTDEERRLTQEARVEVRAQKAERVWAMGEFYYRKGENRAARQYYEQLVKQFPEQKTFVDQATARLQATADKPAKPAVHLVWLSRIFPESIEIPKPIVAPPSE
jgi:outer membrane protein assembly factor BamD (BamD/ComL family)